MVDEPGRRQAHPVVALECKQRQSSFGLADEVDREEPYGHGQFDAHHDGAGVQRRLMPTYLALEQRVGTPTHSTVSGATNPALK